MFFSVTWCEEEAPFLWSVCLSVRFYVFMFCVIYIYIFLYFLFLWFLLFCEEEKNGCTVHDNMLACVGFWKVYCIGMPCRGTLRAQTVSLNLFDIFLARPDTKYSFFQKTGVSVFCMLTRGGAVVWYLFIYWCWRDYHVVRKNKTMFLFFFAIKLFSVLGGKLERVLEYCCTHKKRLTDC